MKISNHYQILFLAIPLFIVVAGCNDGNPSRDLSQEDISNIRELFKQHVEYALTGNTNAIVDQYSDAAIRFPPAGEIITEKGAILAGLNEMGTVVSFEHNLMEIEGSGEVANTWINFKLKLLPPGSNDTLELNGKSLTVLRKVENKWKLHRVMWN